MNPIYEPIFQLSTDKTNYTKLDLPAPTAISVGEKTLWRVPTQTLQDLAFKAFAEISHFLRPAHLQKLQAILLDPQSSPNDVFVAQELLKNAVIAAQGEFPSCQDTGTALVMAKKGEGTLTDGDDEEAFSLGISRAFKELNLRYSQLAPTSMYEEKNTGTNLPAQIEIYATKGSIYEFLFIAKGGGSANKSYLYQKTKSVLNPKSMEEFIRESIVKLGTAACPPYHLAIVIGGTSAEMNLKTVKLASCGYYDSLPTTGSLTGRAFRDLEMESQVEKWARETKIGAQFGGKYFVHDVRVIRLPRHGASCPIGIGVSCAADRQIKAKITADGVFLEELEHNPQKYWVEVPSSERNQLSLDLNQPMEKILESLNACTVSTRVMLTGTMIVARDIAHAKLFERLEKGMGLPDYFKNHPVYYAGPAKTPSGHASGSFGPTTSERMDPYVDAFQKEGGSMVMLGKGNRSSNVKKACQKYGGFYLGSIGGPAARLGKECIKKVEVLDYKELGMEAVWKIEVENFPAFVIIDNKGNDFFDF